MDNLRWRYGDTNPVVAAVDADTVIEIGDLVWQDTDDAKPASALNTDQLSNPSAEQLAWVFLGVAMQRSRKSDTDPIRVATTGVFEFDCLSGTFELGDLVGADEDRATPELLNQQVIKVTSDCAIGRVAKRQSSEVTQIIKTVLVTIQSTVMFGRVRI